ncbi:tannase/feruloyl esterase family alpha/beta hydrolase [Paenarthrobacter sp. NPDC057981]|uniref:tannase/feruloyl esterase family alpha/beta hydrolase n=1 Tax=Paenarthrobacter sp. NPDC057981 TaxID=3346297 RepID=UPI0036DD596A
MPRFVLRGSGHAGSGEGEVTMLDLQRTAAASWVNLSSINEGDEARARCTRATIAEALQDIPGVEVVEVSINDSGAVATPATWAVPSLDFSDMPPYCAVHIHSQDGDGHIANIEVWVPLAWNERFLGVGGAGSRLAYAHFPMVNGVLNGFAVGMTDGGVPLDGSAYEWQISPTTGKNDPVLINTWVHEGTHVMTIVGKAVTAAIHGKEPAFSYFQGGSGGGRQALSSALHHPDDYNGVWSEMPAINWTHLIPAGMWPALVMKELDNPLSPAKLEAFRSAAVEAYRIRSGSLRPFIDTVERVDFDPSALIGVDTPAGVITEQDARVMQMIWDGPTAPDGERLWYGVRPGVEAWGAMGPGLGICETKLDDSGALVPVPWEISEVWFQTWLTDGRKNDWRSLTFDEFARLWKVGLEKFAYVAVDSTDLYAFRDGGGKLLITHGTEDQVIPPESSYEYYDRLASAFGGFDSTSDFARLFVCLGQAHGLAEPGRFNFDLSTGMIALMRWVEHGVAPDELIPVRAGTDEQDPALGVRYVPVSGDSGSYRLRRTEVAAS